jgi:hypothetical protein
MPKKTSATANAPAAATRDDAPRQLRAQCQVMAEAIQPAEGAKPKTNGGRWRLNAGSEMQTRVWGVNMRGSGWDEYPEPIRLVIDLATAQFAKPVIPALSDHITWSSAYTIGNWSNPEVTAAGMTADLRIYEPANEVQATAMAEGVRVKAFMDQGHPWEASIGCEPVNGIDDYQLVRAGQSVQVNGKTFSGDGDMPLYVLRNSRSHEASVVLFGADSDTGRVAAHRQPSTVSKEPTMTIKLSAMLAKYPDHKALVSELVAVALDLADDKRPTAEALDASIGVAVKDAIAKANLDALTAENVRLKAELESKGGNKGEPPAGGKVIAKKTGSAEKPPAFTGGDDAGDAPESLFAGMKQLAAGGCELRGFKLPGGWAAGRCQPPG